MPTFGHVAKANGFSLISGALLCFLLSCPTSAKVADPSPQDTCLTPLISAIHHRDYGQAVELIQSHSDLNAYSCDGSTALIESIALNQFNVTEKLILAGANVNLADRGKNETPLMIAAWYCQQDAVSLLLSKHADVNAIDSPGYSALMLSGQNCQDGRVPVLLIKSGARIDLKTERGDTALTTAAFYGNENVIHVLVAAGADLNSKNKEGESALSIARDRDVGRKIAHDRIYQFLLEVTRIEDQPKDKK
jgi:uncharacterized protein